MILSPAMNFIFLHVPKAAGTSIHRGKRVAGSGRGLSQRTSVRNAVAVLETTESRVTLAPKHWDSDPNSRKAPYNSQIEHQHRLNRPDIAR